MMAAKKPTLKRIEASVYIGRERLGRCVQVERKKYMAFDENDRALGSFRVRARALAAIRKAFLRRRRHQATEIPDKISADSMVPMHGTAARVRVGEASKARKAVAAVSRRTRDGTRTTLDENDELGMLRLAWRGARPSARQRFLVELTDANSGGKRNDP